jgi:hypothetical protein
MNHGTLKGHEVISYTCSNRQELRHVTHFFRQSWTLQFEINLLSTAAEPCHILFLSVGTT